MTRPPLLHIRSIEILGWFVAMGATLGCQSSVYTPQNLPPELLAHRSAATSDIDLTRLARFATPSEQIFVGDVLDVSIVTGLETRPLSIWSLRVAEDGSVNVPLVRQVQVAGLELTEAEQSIRLASIERGLYRDPHVSVLLNQRRTYRVMVVGAVEEPGAYDLPASSCDMLTAIVAAGGLSESASTKVELTTPSMPTQGGTTELTQQVSFFTESGPSMGQQRRARFDLTDLEAGRGGVPLEDGAVVMVLDREPETIHVMGLVNNPDRFEMEEDEVVRVLDAIAMAGGRTLQLADKVRVIRQSPVSDAPAVIDISLRKAKTDPRANLVLAPGDVVSIEETPLTFTVETLRDFVRFGFSSAVPGL